MENELTHPRWKGGKLWARLAKKQHRIPKKPTIIGPDMAEDSGILERGQRGKELCVID